MICFTHQTHDIANANASEADKIQAALYQSYHDYDPSK